MSDSKDKKTRGRSLADWLVRGLDLPPEMLQGGMRVEVRGRDALMVEGCRKILAYTPDEVKLQMAGCLLVIEGEGMLCHSYLSGAVGLEGRVCCIRYEEGVC